MPRTRWKLTPVVMEQSGVPRREARRQLWHLARRHWWRDLAASFSEFAAYIFMLMLISGLVLLLMSTGFLPDNDSLFLSLTMPVCVAGSIWFVYRSIRRAHRRLLRYMQAPTCFRCGYSLHGLAPDRPDLLVIKCPECGNASPCTADAAGLAGAAAISAPTLNP